MAIIELDGETSELLLIGDASIAEGSTPAGLLPQTAVDAALRERSSDIAALMRAELNRGFTPSLPETLLVSKPLRGRRPVALLAPRDRVLYRALTDALGDSVPMPDRSSIAYDSFKRAPLTDPGPAFIVMADVAACYEYVDHEILGEELIARTADPFLTGAIIGFLRGVSGRAFGLPQNRQPSHRLAELILAIPERTLLRKGYALWRYSDDFRIGAADLSSAHEALEHLEAAVRSIGLTLNDEKSSIRTWQSYQDWTEAIAVRVSEIETETEFELASFDYEGNITEPDRAEVMVGAAVRLLELWHADVDERRNQYGPEAVVGRQVVGIALGVLGAVGVGDGLRYCREILTHEPALALQVSSYMSRLMTTDLERAVDAALDQVLASTVYVSPWQSLWLMEPLGKSSGLTTDQESWLSHLAGRTDYIGAAASCVLARHGEADVDRLISSFDHFTAASRPLVAEAITRQRYEVPPVRVASIYDDDPVMRWIAETIEHSDA